MTLATMMLVAATNSGADGAPAALGHAAEVKLFASTMATVKVVTGVCPDMLPNAAYLAGLRDRLQTIDADKPAFAHGGTHQWSGTAIEPVDVLALSSRALKGLMESVPGFAICLIEGLEAKGRCYTAVAQMLGTRSVIERLAQLLLNLGRLYGQREGDAIAIEDMISHDEIAALVGSTRQWVTMMLKRFRYDRIVSAHERSFRILRSDTLEAIVLGDAKAATLPSRDQAQSTSQQTNYA